MVSQQYVFEMHCKISILIILKMTLQENTNESYNLHPVVKIYINNTMYYGNHCLISENNISLLYNSHISHSKISLYTDTDVFSSNMNIYMI